MLELLNVLDIRMPKDGFKRTGCWMLLAFLGLVVGALLLASIVGSD